MNCVECRVLLELGHEHRLMPAELAELSNHLVRCRDCAVAAEGLRRADDIVRRAVADLGSTHGGGWSDFRARVLAATTQADQALGKPVLLSAAPVSRLPMSQQPVLPIAMQPSRRRWSMIAVLSGIAAVLALSIGIAQLLSDSATITPPMLMDRSVSETDSTARPPSISAKPTGDRRPGGVASASRTGGPTELPALAELGAELEKCVPAIAELSVPEPVGTAELYKLAGPLWPPTTNSSAWPDSAVLPAGFPLSDRPAEPKTVAMSTMPPPSEMKPIPLTPIPLTPMPPVEPTCVDRGPRYQQTVQRAERYLGELCHLSPTDNFALAELNQRLTRDSLWGELAELRLEAGLSAERRARLARVTALLTRLRAIGGPFAEADVIALQKRLTQSARGGDP